MYVEEEEAVMKLVVCGTNGNYYIGIGDDVSEAWLLVIWVQKGPKDNNYNKIMCLSVLQLLVLYICSIGSSTKLERQKWKRLMMMRQRHQNNRHWLERKKSLKKKWKQVTGGSLSSYCHPTSMALAISWCRLLAPCVSSSNQSSISSSQKTHSGGGSNSLF